MSKPELRFLGVELYFERLQEARRFYTELGLEISDEQSGQYAKFDSGIGFVCLERKGSEIYRSRDKAVLFFEAADLAAAVKSIGKERFVRVETNWAVMHGPEGHNLLFLEKRQAG